MKLTDWYPAHVKPVRAGLYETSVDGAAFPMWSVWTGEHWSKASCELAWVVSHARSGGSLWQERQWRGLTAPAK